MIRKIPVKRREKWGKKNQTKTVGIFEFVFGIKKSFLPTKSKKNLCYSKIKIKNLIGEITVNL